MLEKLRKQGASAIIYVLFGILIAGFVINFGPQSGGGSEGCSGSPSDTVLEVDGVDQGRAAWQFVYNTFDRVPRRQRSEYTLESLLLREILAQEAERRGLEVSEQLVDDKLKQGEIYVRGNRIDVDTACVQGLAPQFCYFRQVGDQWFFDFDLLKAVLANMSMSIPNFKEQQQRELLAGMMKEILINSVPASRDEALARYVHENTTVDFDAVQFDPASYRAAMKLTTGDVDRFLAGHEAEVKAKFDAEAASYKGVPAQVHLRQIFVKKADAAPSAEPAPGQIATPAPSDPGKTEIEKIREEITSGKRSFVEVATASNEDASLAALGGDLGWRAVDAPGLLDPALNDAVKPLKAGEVSPVITTRNGYYLLTVEGEPRKGDLTYDQVKRELALELARTTWSKEAAKRDALAGLAKVREGTGQNLDAVFPRGAPKLRPDEQPFFNKSGSITHESKDVPAEWIAQAETAAPAAAPGATAPAAGAPAAPAAPATAAPAPAAPLTASADVLPTMGEVAKPSTLKYGPLTRDREDIANLGKSADLMRALFDELAAGMIGPEVYEVDGTYVLVQLAEKKTAKVEDFDKDATKNVESLARERGNALLARWINERCKVLADGGKISYAKDRVTEHDDQGNALPITYQPCQHLTSE
jgi:hypothetical protein